MEEVIQEEVGVGIPGPGHGINISIAGCSGVGEGAPVAEVGVQLDTNHSPVCLAQSFQILTFLGVRYIHVQLQLLAVGIGSGNYAALLGNGVAGFLQLGLSILKVIAQSQRFPLGIIAPGVIRQRQVGCFSFIVLVQSATDSIQIQGFNQSLANQQVAGRTVLHVQTDVGNLQSLGLHQGNRTAGIGNGVDGFAGQIGSQLNLALNQSVGSLRGVLDELEGNTLQVGSAHPVVFVSYQNSLLIFFKLFHDEGACTAEVNAQVIAPAFNLFRSNNGVAGIGQSGQEGSVGSLQGAGYFQIAGNFSLVQHSQTAVVRELGGTI